MENGRTIMDLLGRTKIVERVGAEKGCMQCMRVALDSYDKANYLIGKYPILLEMAIRGHHYAFDEIRKLLPDNLQHYWLKIAENLDHLLDNEGKLTVRNMRKDLKQTMQKRCHACKREEGTFVCKSCEGCDDKENVEVKLKECTGCKFYCFCSEECHKHSLKHDFHINHCKQQQILEKYHKPHAQSIKDKLLQGVYPESIHELQVLREKLGLTKSPNDPFFEKRYGIEYHKADLDDSDGTYFWVARKNGKIPIGFASEKI
jgi:hypothetical protein